MGPHLCQRVPDRLRSLLSCSHWTVRRVTQTSPQTWSFPCILQEVKREKTSTTTNMPISTLLTADGRALMLNPLWMRSRASSFVRVMFCSLQDDGRRDWLCFTRRCEQRTWREWETIIKKKNDEHRLEVRYSSQSQPLDVTVLLNLELEELWLSCPLLIFYYI